jgi:hypothetical protein
MSMLFLFSNHARRTLRPIRPKPLIPTFTIEKSPTVFTRVVYRRARHTFAMER